ncbi:unnamed protein product [Rhizopus stolonifer]
MDAIGRTDHMPSFNHVSCIYRLESPSPESSRPSITILSAHSPQIHMSWNQIFVHQAYILDTSHNRIRRRRRNELHSYPRIINSFFKALDNHQIWLLDFFLLRCLTNPNRHIITDTGRVDFSWWVEALKPSWLISTDTTTF